MATGGEGKTRPTKQMPFSPKAPAPAKKKK